MQFVLNSLEFVGKLLLNICQRKKISRGWEGDFHIQYKLLVEVVMVRAIYGFGGYVQSDMQILLKSFHCL